jgi:hypothetical protein
VWNGGGGKVVMVEINSNVCTNFGTIFNSTSLTCELPLSGSMAWMSSIEG